MLLVLKRRREIRRLNSENGARLLKILMKIPIFNGDSSVFIKKEEKANKRVS